MMTAVHEATELAVVWLFPGRRQRLTTRIEMREWEVRSNDEEWDWLPDLPEDDEQPEEVNR
jgi:hypothetical protein